MSDEYNLAYAKTLKAVVDLGDRLLLSLQLDEILHTNNAVEARTKMLTIQDSLTEQQIKSFEEAYSELIRYDFSGGYRLKYTQTLGGSMNIIQKRRMPVASLIYSLVKDYN